MRRNTPVNLAASVHRRLVDYAREHNDEAQLVFMRYGLERLTTAMPEHFVPL